MSSLEIDERKYEAANSPGRLVKIKFHAGLHNIGYIVAIGAWLGCFYVAAGHFLFAGSFKVLGRRTECEQPLNNRCIYVYKLQDVDGAIYDEHFFGLATRQGDLDDGNLIYKDRYSFSYKVNGEEISWYLGPRLIIISMLAFFPFELARRSKSSLPKGD